MTRLLLLFAVGFVVAAGVTTVIRSIHHQTYLEQPRIDLAPAAPMTGQKPVADQPLSDQPGGSASNPHAGHDTIPVNTICSICGMPVNPKLPFAVYQGKTIGFGCATCPAKFAAAPDHYGPAAVANRMAEDSP